MNIFSSMAFIHIDRKSEAVNLLGTEGSHLCKAQNSARSLRQLCNICQTIMFVRWGTAWTRTCGLTSFARMCQSRCCDCWDVGSAASLREPRTGDAVKILIRTTGRNIYPLREMERKLERRPFFLLFPFFDVWTSLPISSLINNFCLCNNPPIQDADGGE